MPTLVDRGWTVVVGVDVSADQLRVACSRVGDVAEALVRADARELPFEDASFDIVLAVLVPTDIAGSDMAVREAARVLRPGGRFVRPAPLLREPSRPHERRRIAEPVALAAVRDN